MIAFESQRCRRLLVRLDAPDRVRASLAKLAESHAIGTAWIRGSGTVAWIELARFDPRSRSVGDVRRYENAELLSLAGHLCLKDGAPYATIRAAARLVENGAIVGGVLQDCGVLAMDLVLEVFEDVLLSLTTDAATGLDRWVEAVAEAENEGGAPSTASPSAPVASWASVATASEQTSPSAALSPSPDSPSSAREKRMARKRAPSADPKHFRGYDPDGRRASRAAKKQRRTEPVSMKPGFVPPPLPTKRRMSETAYFDEPIPEKGEWVDHKVFGLCRVDGEDADGGLIIRLPSGVRKAIKLDVLEVLEPRIEDEKIIYPLRPRVRS